LLSQILIHAFFYRNPVYKTSKLQEAEDIGIDRIIYVDGSKEGRERAEERVDRDFARSSLYLSDKTNLEKEYEQNLKFEKAQRAHLEDTYK
jgi:hypothetical protein